RGRPPVPGVQLAQPFDHRAQATPGIRVREAFVDDGVAGTKPLRERLGEQLLLGREVAVQRRRADAGVPGDLPHRRGQSFGGEHGPSRLQQAFAVVTGVRTPDPRQRTGHRLTLAEPDGCVRYRRGRLELREMTVKAVAVQTFGEPAGLAVVDVPDPRPAAGEVVITTEAIGVGGVDVLIRRGALAAFGFEAGHVLGGEVAGVVTALGANVDESWAGARVWAPTDGGGGYAEQALVPAAALVPL